MSIISSINGTHFSTATSFTSGLQGKSDADGSSLVLKFERDRYFPSGNHPISGQLRSIQGSVRASQVVAALAQSAGYTLQEVQQSLYHIQSKSTEALSTDSEEEIGLLQGQIDRVSQNISDLFAAHQFDQANIFNGTFSEKGLLLGGNRERGILGRVTPEAIEITISNLETNALGAGVYVISRNGVNSLLSLSGSEDDTRSLTINDYLIGESLRDDDTLSIIDRAESAIAKAAAINRVTKYTEVQAFALPSRTDNQSELDLHLRGFEARLPTYLGNTGHIKAIHLDEIHNLMINGVTFKDLSVSVADSDSTLRDAINAKTSDTGVKASLSDLGELTLKGIDGRNIYVNYSDGPGGTTEEQIGLLGYRGVAYGGRVMLYSQSPFTLDFDPRVNESLGDFIGDYRFSGQQSFNENNLFSIGDYDVTSDSGRNASPIVLARAFEQVLNELDYLERFDAFFLNTSTRIYQSLVGEGIDDPLVLDSADDAIKTAKYVGNYILASQDSSVTSQAQFQPRMISSLLDGSFVNTNLQALKASGTQSTLNSLTTSSSEASARISQFVEASRATPVGLFESRNSLLKPFGGEED